MKITIDIPEPKFKIGDFITHYIGENKDYRGIFWVGAIEFCGEWAYLHKYPRKNPTLHISNMKDNEIYCRYSISCQEDMVDRETGEVWFKKGQMSWPAIHEVDDSKSEKIDWPHDPIPLPQ